MGRITVFSLSDCPHCKRVKTALESRDLPYVEISLTSYPHKRNDMLSLTDRLTVPQVFVNDKHIGGSDEVHHLLEALDKDPQTHAAPYNTYKELVESLPDPTDPRLEVPTSPPVQEKAAPPRVEKDKFLQLPNKNGRYISALDATKELMSFLPRGDLSYRAKVYKDCFMGRDGVTSIMKHYGLTNREDAISFGRTLQKQRLLDHVTGDHMFGDTGMYFRLQAYHEPNVLNTFIRWTERIDTDVMGLISRLKKLLGQIESSSTDKFGMVDYEDMSTDPRYLEFEEQVCELQGVQISSMDETTRLAFGINLYNLMVKHAFVKVGIASSSLSRSTFFGAIGYDVGGDILSLSELENGVLRGNAPPPYQVNRPFGKHDSRRELAMSKVDPRIHFALNCGAKSCPPVKKFTAEAVEEELRVVAQAFCEQDENVRVDEDKNELGLSMIMKWYRQDFAKSTEELPLVVVGYLRGEKKEMLQRMIDSKQRPIKIKFNKYDWGTNAANSRNFECNCKVKANDFKVRRVICTLGL